ncbi:hypothetical protein [Paenibacillus endoradicis]|uniref:hypothetical protein n=1 Tax=Paenibacillus endoradicis TaxID=2972487 RepID=UPI002159B101|nr:hypothetical protein [Paenibacillus endoradicis]MCR8659568.1 hypothetical protein [Paenibacillus endoradicis]
MENCLDQQLALIEQHKQVAYLNHTEVCSVLLPKHSILSDKAMALLEQIFSVGTRAAFFT